MITFDVENLRGAIQAALINSGRCQFEAAAGVKAAGFIFEDVPIGLPLAGASY
jgi:hypothetical protein